MHNIDALDQQILRVLTKDARTPRPTSFHTLSCCPYYTLKNTF